ncbi:MAG: TatD family hydrolase [Planctomycetes bacterium]|nr:TatD family hydrolase [Planctomycetota bacterium]
MIDTHCHLTFPDFAGKTRATLDQARQHGVSACVSISTTTADCLEALALAKAFTGEIFCTSGIHPLHSHEGPHEWGNLLTVIRDERCVAWGELGLDRHYTEPDQRTQRAILDEHLALIKSATDLAGRSIVKPVVIHCREAFAELIPILRDSGIDPSRFVFHCFTGTPKDMALLLDFGAYVSFTGVITYKNARDIREAARLAPIGRILVETDAPFLSPDPHRSVRPCAPWMTSVSAKALAVALDMAFEELHDHLRANTARFFGLIESVDGKVTLRSSGGAG